MSEAENIVGDYKLGQELGRGSFATVFLAENLNTKEKKAVKKIDRSRLSPKLLQNLESEISILRDFQHENIVKLYGIMKNPSHIFLFLEFCGGGDLHKYIRLKGKLSEPVAQHFMRHLARGLIFLWEKQLIHRDIKPQNLLLTSQSDNATLKIADFGFARHLETAALADTLCGSPLYMAPEILTFQKYDGKADLWSAGTVLFEMLAGRPPYGGANQSELVANIRTKEIRLPAGVQISSSCIAMIQMLLQRKPAKRATFERFLAAEFIQPIKQPEQLDQSSRSQQAEETNPTGDSSSVYSMAQAAAEAVSGSTSDPWNHTRGPVTRNRAQSLPVNLQPNGPISPVVDRGGESGDHPWSDSSRRDLSPSDGAMIKSPYQSDSQQQNWPVNHAGLQSAHGSFDPQSQFHSGYYSKNKSQHGYSQQAPPSTIHINNNSQRNPYDSRQRNPFMQPLAASPPEAFSFARFAHGNIQPAPAPPPRTDFNMGSPMQQPMSTVAEGEDSDEWLVVDNVEGGSGSWAARSSDRKITPRYDIKQATLLSPRRVNNSNQNEEHQKPSQEETAHEFLSRMGGMVGNMELLGRCAMAVARVGDGAAAQVLSSQVLPSLAHQSGPLAALLEDNADSDSGGIPSPISPPSALSPGSNFPVNLSKKPSSRSTPSAPQVPLPAPPGVVPFSPPSNIQTSQEIPVQLDPNSVSSTSSRGSNSGVNRSGSLLGNSENLADALLLYLKSMGLVKRAVELGRSILDQIRSVRAFKNSQTNSSGEIDLNGLPISARALAGRANELLTWLSSQYGLLLDRAEKCREQRSSFLAESNSQTSNESKSSSGGAGGGRVQIRIYSAALQLARAAAVKEVLGNHELGLRMYRHGQLLIESLLLEPNITPSDHAVLSGYDNGFQDRIAHLQMIINHPEHENISEDILGKAGSLSSHEKRGNESSSDNEVDHDGLSMPPHLPRILSDDRALAAMQQIAPPMMMLPPRSLQGPGSPMRHPVSDVSGHQPESKELPFSLNPQFDHEDEGAAFA